MSIYNTHERNSRNRNNRKKKSVTLTNTRAVDKFLGEDRIKMAGPDATQKNLVRKLVISNLHRCRIDVVENNEIFPEI